MKISVQLALWPSRASLTLMDCIGDYILPHCNCAWYKDELQTFIIKDNKVVNTFQGCKECVYNENGSKPSHKWHLCITALQSGVSRCTPLHQTLADLLSAVPTIPKWVCLKKNCSLCSLWILPGPNQYTEPVEIFV